jgi:hypothetical protein
MNNKQHIIKTDKPLCPWDVISYSISLGQLLIIKEEIKPLEYKVEVATNSGEKLGTDNFKKGATLFKLFNVMGGTKENPCSNDSDKLTLIDIE